MTSTLCQGAALDRIIAPWMAVIAMFLHAIVKTIMAIMPKLKTMCRHARRLRHRTELPATALHAAIRAAAQTTDNRKADLDVSLSAQRHEASQVAGPEPGRTKLMDPEEAEAHDTGSERQTCPHVKCSCGFVYQGFCQEE